jgi:hypothetical protein
MPSRLFANMTAPKDTSFASSARFCKPRGLRFDLNGILYCVAQDEVVAFDFASSACLGAIVHFPRLNGQAIALYP